MYILVNKQTKQIKMQCEDKPIYDKKVFNLIYLKNKKKEKDDCKYVDGKFIKDTSITNLNNI